MTKKKEIAAMVIEQDARITMLECYVKDIHAALHQCEQIDCTLEPWAVKPIKAHNTDAGFDLYCPQDVSITRGGEFLFSNGENGLVDKGVVTVSKVLQIDTGVHVLIPEHFEGTVRPRSSLSKKGINCTFGTVDAGYTGSIKVCYQMSDIERYIRNQKEYSNDYVQEIKWGIPLFKKGERIAQLVISPICKCNVLREVENFIEVTERGDNGFGSSGR